MAMRVSKNKSRNNPKKSDIISGFTAGLNNFQDETLIKDSELTEAKNILLDVDGIQPRPGTVNYESGTDSSVQGALAYYNSDGTRELLRVSNGKLYKYVSGTPTQIGSETWSTTADVNMIQARDNIYIFDGESPLRYYDGSTITTYTSISEPSAPTVTPQGTTGATTYAYRVSAFNEVGETLASTATLTTTGTSDLSISNFNRVSWGTVSGATGYNVWGREPSGLATSYLTTVYTSSYDDNGLLDQSTTIIEPEGNTTLGVVGSMAIFALDRLFVAGNPDYPSRLYWGGTGANIGNFSGDRLGGSFVDIYRNDGAQIRAIAPFQGGVIIWKDNAIYKLTFTNSIIADAIVETGKLEEVTRSFGGISFRGVQAVENDIVFPAKKDGRLAFYSLGNQENYAGSVLRTNELSIKVQDKLQDVSVSRLTNTAAFYFNNVYGCGVTKSGNSTNDRIWCLDTRFGAWTYWEGFNPRLFVTFEDSDGNVDLMYGNESTGFLTKMFQTDRNDNGSAIAVQFATKSFNQKVFHRLKEYFNPTFQFKEVNQSGAITGEIYLDGAILDAGFSVNQQITGGAGMGVSLPGFSLFGEADGGQASTTGISSDIVIEVRMTREGRSLKFNFRSESADLYYKFLSVAFDYAVKNKRLPGSVRYYPTG